MSASSARWRGRRGRRRRGLPAGDVDASDHDSGHRATATTAIVAPPHGNDAMSGPAPIIDQVEFWNGEVGRKWADNQERMDRSFRPLTMHLLDAASVPAGARIIDVGC